MRISPKLNSFSVFVAVVAFAVALVAGPAAAQNTSSSIRVVVTGQGGAPVSGLSVAVTHVPTGRTQIISSNDQGIATLRGIKVGGPYDVSVVGGGEYAADVMQDIYAELDKTEVVNLAVRPVIEEVVVTAQAPTGEVIVGVGRAFDRSTIDGTPSLSRDFIETLGTDPKIMVDNSVRRGPAVSLAGQNFRFNSVTIDGVAQNDNFGLSKNASATQRTPISIDAIEAVMVNIAPYDVSYGNFIGGNINIVTKSGSNDFEGSVYAFSTGDSLSGDKSDGEDLALGDFSEEYYGFTLGGPIVRDKLFFFVNYEKFETDLPSNAQTIDKYVPVLRRLTSIEPSAYFKTLTILIRAHSMLTTLTRTKRSWSSWTGTSTTITASLPPIRVPKVTLFLMTFRKPRRCFPIGTTSPRNSRRIRCDCSRTGLTISVRN